MEDRAWRQAVQERRVVKFVREQMMPGHFKKWSTFQVYASPEEASAAAAAAVEQGVALEASVVEEA